MQLKCFVRFLGLIILISAVKLVKGQKIIQHKEYAYQLIKLSEQTQIPAIENGFTLWIPEVPKVKGLIVFFHSRMDTSETESIIDIALEHDLAVLYATTNNRVEFLFNQAKMEQLHAYLGDAMEQTKVRSDKLLYCGMSLAGTRALKMSIYSQEEKGEYAIIPKAIAICDAPLDMVRFYKEATKASNLNFNPIAANEGNWVSQYLNANLGGSPDQKLLEYIDYSPYCYISDIHSKLPYFSKIHIRAYTEPDVRWWMETRRKDYYGMNALDLAAFINELHISGNEYAELILTDNKGFRTNGDRHPHSWSIVDENELVQWFLGLIE